MTPVFKKYTLVVFISFLIFILNHPPSWSWATSAPRAVETEGLTMMTYNVENLFDTHDDPLKDDETYLPLKLKQANSQIQKKCKRLKSKDWQSQCLNLNWDKKTLYSKMNRLSDVILKSNKGIGPDILILQEVENLSVLEELRLKFLKKHYPYEALLLEGPDQRGIDVAILSKLKPKTSPKLHVLKFASEVGLPKNKLPKTRGILEAEFKLSDDSSLFVFGVHFPSQGTPSPARKQALKQLTDLMNQKPKNSFVIAGGDFNITSFEEDKHKYFSNLKESFLISHLAGCKTCKGTNYFHPRRSWSFLDVLVFSNNFKDPKSSWALDTTSIRIYNKNLYQNNKWGSPMKFEAGRQQQGVSDHWPLLSDIFKNSSRSNGTFK